MTPVEYILADSTARLKQVYTDAAKVAIKKMNGFLNVVKKIDDGKITAPMEYIMSGREDEWRRGWILQAARQFDVIETCANQIRLAGLDASKVIDLQTAHMYATARAARITAINAGCASIGYKPQFYTFNTRAIKTLIKSQQPPFTKIAYANLANADVVNKILERSFANAIISGTKRADLVKETTTIIKGAADTFYERNILGAVDATAEQMEARARRICQTEMTRVESEAEYDVAREAIDQGVELEREWICRYQNSRDSHMDMAGQIVTGDEPFTSGSGNKLRFPVDPLCDDPADVINCHCAVVERVKSHSDALAEHRARMKEQREEWLSKTIGDGTFNRWRNDPANPEEVQTWR